MMCLAYNSLELKNALHEAVCSDAFSSEEFVQVVKGLGKDRLATFGSNSSSICFKISVR